MAKAIELEPNNSLIKLRYARLEKMQNKFDVLLKKLSEINMNNLDEYGNRMEIKYIFEMIDTRIRFAETLLETDKNLAFSILKEALDFLDKSDSSLFDFTILGGQKMDCEEIIQILLPCYDGRHSFRIVESKVAELTKFMENSFLATKISFCNSFFNVCEKENISYEELRELFILDPRVNPSHTFVYRDTPYWDSHCLNKDVTAIANQYDMKLLKNIIDFKKKKKKL